MGSKPNIFSLWFRATRLPFLAVPLVSAALGSSLAYRDGFFSGNLFVLTLLAVAAINIGTNLSNDYFDFKSGADQLNHKPTPFSGGSRVIQEGLLSPGRILGVAIAAYVVSAVIGLFLLTRTGPGLWCFGLTGILLSFFYTAPPLRLGYRGWGETVVGVLLGPLVVMGAYYVFSRDVSPAGFFLSLTPGFLIASILFINQFPDRESDARAGKRHWVTRLEPETAVRVYMILIAAAFIFPVFFVLLDLLPPAALLCFLALPLALRAMVMIKRFYGRPSELVPAQALTIKVHLIAGLGMIFGLIFV